ncbi:hypothetical protein D3C73_1206200 [compost metagenome]
MITAITTTSSVWLRIGRASSVNSLLYMTAPSFQPVIVLVAKDMVCWSFPEANWNCPLSPANRLLIQSAVTGSPLCSVGWKTDFCD